MRLIDVAVKDLEMIGDCRTCGNKTPFCDSNPDSCKGYKWRGAPPGSAAEENPPLTLEELREMDGEPVWVYNSYNGWCNCRVVECIKPEDVFFTDGTARRISSYGDGWLAYRRRPEEGTA